MTAHLRPLLLTLSIGFGGALLAHFAGLPAAPLIGSTLAVSCASLLRIARDIPNYIRDTAFVIIGCSLGSGITREALAQSIHWPVSLLALSVAVCATIFCCSWVITRFYGLNRETAVLASTPGALAYILALTGGGSGDARAVIVIQSIRLLLVTTLLPLVLASFNLHVDGAIDVRTSMSLAELAAIIFCALAAGWFLTRLRVPAAFFLSGIIVSGFAHFSGLVVGWPAPELIFVGFVITGTVVGTRFSTIPLADLKALLLVSLNVLVLSVSLSAIFAAPVAAFLSMPFGQVFVAFAPGGVEAMAAIAFSLGYDPAFVATHHLFRIIFLICVVPLFLRIRKKE